MAQQYPYHQSQGQPPAQYPPSQLYPPHQCQGGSLPSSPYQQPAQPYPGPGYAQPPSRTPSPYQQSPRSHSPYQQPPPPQALGYQPYPPPQYPPQQYPPQGYPPPQPGSQYGFPSPQPPPQLQGPYTLIFQSSGKHIKTLTPQGSSQPSYTAIYSRPLFYSSAPDIAVTSNDTQLATINWHTWSGKIDMSFTTGNTITYKDNFESSTLGRLFWVISRGDRKQANIRCSDRAEQTICTVVLTDKLESGRVEIWRSNLSKQQFDEVIVSAIAEIEDFRRKVQDQGPNPGVVAGLSVAAGC
ncbi:uncharacterized protein Z518_03084 [Rhinocladiella mackenziei CBS 650.93]|uniref:Rhinocladiella mackenziei CBS 650.93 unplaced genomic scaffold supercont1.2, whole genome shotgun sequence n=1 Tax=Rhinocladiella mackenziei CBS 650.93 TaxID=1442369 RepID=A0A0D2HD73_9EURO|nr:uncharacterized protein Z518_03084 [Rhinocladiella mackenziei CBS 650.93]KIX08428.1 hypothetical protein Z518_03084 [Rhinocladiella mackenziei CBS 650.93]